MRRLAILIVLAGLWVSAAPAAAQLPDVPLPDEPLPDVPLPDVPDVDPPDVPDVELPGLPDGGGGGGGGDGGGGGGLLPSLEPPSTGDSGGDSGSSSGAGSGGGGSGSGGDSGSGSGGSSGGGGGSGSGSGGDPGSASCPCATSATGYPVAGDYDKCPLDRESGDASPVLAASGSANGSGDAGQGGGVLGAGAFGEGASAPPGADLVGDGSSTSLVAAGLLALAGLGLLIGLAGGLKALHGRLGSPS